jgi:predicted Rossmann fold nucleotide-binding protein DprA/Smf involved in DNA uptake
LADRRRITIISGGQTGADRAALDFAIEHGLPHGGWCPRARLAEDGPISARYELRETPSRKYAQRTEWNIRDSDATLVLSIAADPKGGTRLTLDLARRLGKPVLHVSRAASGGDYRDLAAQVDAFLSEHAVQILNVAGPRASQEPEVTAFVWEILQGALHRTESA